ncbi:hypothetical protein [Butyrivibrio sp.]|uniref:hypothetical protein n=1 Tax=Butyrivibrio sp. TaxID=28121 RepID=UPI0025BEE707|nr:hypothetical protein [Butyrivibrio sp.]MBQ9304048.1 hypothetical protein [Butyrivibrio sp.]MBQ9304477.1 hypothetical protein [Butyrivibrio sp.]
MAYQSNAELAKDNHSSGAMLIIVGIIGIVIDLIVFSTNPFNVPEFNRFLSCGVMLALFILFIVMGILSLRTYKILVVKAAEEDNLKKELTKWCDDNLTKEKIAVEIYELEHSEDEEAAESVVSENMAETIVKEADEEVEIIADDEAEPEDDNLQEEAIDRIDEALFFARTEAMKKIISQNFINLDSDLLDSFVDEYYVKVYDDQESND